MPLSHKDFRHTIRCGVFELFFLFWGALFPRTADPFPNPYAFTLYPYWMSCNWIVSQAAGQIFRFSRILTEPTPCWETSPLELLLLFNSGEWTRTHCSPIWYFCRIEGTTRQCLKTVLLCFSTAATAQGGFGVAVFTLQPQICAGRWHFPEKIKKSWEVTWPKTISWHLPENVSGRAFSQHTLQSLARKHFFKNMLDAQKSDCFFSTSMYAM